MARESCFPAAAQAALVDMPKGALEAGLGTVRAATIRKHVREFKKLSAYCKAVSDRAWPKDVGVVFELLARKTFGTLLPFGAACYILLHSLS